MGDTSRNQEILENKFLIERFLLKLLETQKISQEQVQDLKWLFRKELLSHEQRTPKERLEILVAVFREWKNKQSVTEQTVHSVTHDSDPPALSKTVATNNSEIIKNVELEAPVLDAEPPVLVQEKVVPAEEEIPTQDSVVLEQVAETAQKPISVSQTNENQILTDLVTKLVDDDIELVGEHRESVNTLLLEEVEHVSGTGMHVSVVKRYLVNVLERYKREHDLKYKAKELEIVAPVAKPIVEADSNPPKPEDIPDPDTSVLHSTKDDTQVAEVHEPTVPESSVETVEQLHEIKTKEEEVLSYENNPTEVNVASQKVIPAEVPKASNTVEQTPELPPEPHAAPEVSTSEMPSEHKEEEPLFKTKVTSGSTSAQAGLHGKSLASIILKQAREDDQKKPLISHQEVIPIPEKPKQLVKKPVDISHVKIIEEEGIDPEKFAAPRQKGDIPQEEIKKAGLGVASNTFVSFEKDIELDGEQIERRHEVRSQQKKLFEKYVEEQIDTVLQVISNHRVYDTLTLGSIREALTQEAMSVADKDELSISDKIHELDTLFTQKRDEYVKNHVVDPHTPLEQMVDVIMARAGQEVRTKDPEADARFRETLRDTLHFKAKHLLGVGTEKNAIQAALDEEYVKHKTFYFKTSV
jgi:hypothetical protein